jgi:hypothetical protein
MEMPFFPPILEIANVNPLHSPLFFLLVISTLEANNEKKVQHPVT